MINPLNHHYSMENPASVYDEEALTALVLAGRTTAKVNETVQAFNDLEVRTGDRLDNQDTAIQKMNDETMPAKVKAEFKKNLDNGTFEGMVDTYAGELTDRLDNLLGKVSEGSTTGDAELIDARTDIEGNAWSNAGGNIRHSQKRVNSLLDAMTVPVLVDSKGTYNNGFYSRNGTFNENTGYYCFSLNVTPGEVYYYSGRYGYDSAGVSCYDASGNNIKNYFYAPSAQGREDRTTPFTIPEGCVLIKVSSKKSNMSDRYPTPVPGLWKVVGYENNPGVLGEYIDNLANTLSHGEEHYTSVGDVSNGYLDIYTVMNDESVTGYDLITVDVKPGETYRFHASAHWGKNFYCLYDNTGYPIIISDTAENVAKATEMDLKLTIPVGGARLRVAGLTADSKGGPSVEKLVDRVGTPTESMWSHLKWVCLGDSLTEENIRTTKHYHTYIKDKTGIGVVNMGVSGTGYYARKDAGTAFFQRALNIPVDTDVVTIFGSGNDLGYVTDNLGTPTDTGTDTICGCINTAIDNIYSINPVIQLGIVSPTPWNSNTPDKPNCKMYKYTEALKTICENRGIPFLDLFRCSGFRPDDATFRSLAFSKDPEGVANHPDETGHKLISGQFYAFLQKLIGTY